MTVAFNNMPANNRVPFFYAEINAGQSPYQGQSRTLLIGRVVSGGSAATDVPVRIVRDPASLFGAGSELSEMATYARLNNPLGEIWGLPIADAGTKQTKTITIATLTSQQGVLVVYVNGTKVQVPVNVTDTNATVAAALSAEINKGWYLNGQPMTFPVIATVSTNVVTLTARNGGAPSASFDVSKDLVGDEGALASFITIASGTAGSGAISFSAGLANLGDQEFDWIGIPDSDVTTLNTLQTFLNEVSGRWSPLQQVYGMAITAKLDTVSNLTTFGAARNNPNEIIMGVPASASGIARWVGALCGAIGSRKNLGAELSSAIEISRPMQTIPLIGIQGSKNSGDAPDTVERNAAYNDGISGYYISKDGTVRLDRVITTYQTNAFAQNDITWLDIETRAQAVYIARYIRQRITQLYPRCALANDNPSGLQGLVTPKELKAAVIHAYIELENAGIVENSALFAQSLIVERSSDPNRIDAYLPVDVVNQLRVFAANITINLQTAA